MCLVVNNAQSRLHAMLLRTTITLLCATIFHQTQPLGLKEEFTWSKISYDIPEEKLRDLNYIYENNVPMGANRWRNKLFITVPRRRDGVPSTLNYIWTNSSDHHNVPLIPYPDLESNILDTSGSGRSFVSIYRVSIDSCDRLWCVDIGSTNALGRPNQHQPRALIIIDLNTDKIIKRHEFNTSLFLPTTELVNPVVDTSPDSCDDAFVYIPDLAGYGLIVYSLNQDKAWRVEHNYFHLEPLAGNLKIAGFKFQWIDGIFSVALSDVNRNGFRDAYFHAMVGTHLYKVSTEILKNESLATRNYHGDDFKVLGDRGENSQTSASAVHPESGVLFMGFINENAVACWKLGTAFRDISIVQKDARKMVYPADLKISGDDVIVLTNNMPIFIYSKLDYAETNFRVWIGNVGEAVEGTKCAGPRRDGKDF